MALWINNSAGSPMYISFCGSLIFPHKALTAYKMLFLKNFDRLKKMSGKRNFNLEMISILPYLRLSFHRVRIKNGLSVSTLKPFFF